MENFIFNIETKEDLAKLARQEMTDEEYEYFLKILYRKED